MPKESPTNPHPLDYMFHPRSIAMVGISADLAKFWMRQLYFDALVQSGYPGQIYLVNPKGGELEGRPIYRTLTEIPGQVDHVVVSIPARFTPALMEECRAKGVKVGPRLRLGFCRDRRARPDRAAEPTGGDRPPGKHADHRPQLPGPLLPQGQDRPEP